jgi:hypothetical protein
VKNLLHRNDSFFTVGSKNLNISSCVLRSHVVWVVLQVYLCGHQHPECERAIRLICSPFFCKLRSSSDPTNKHLTCQRQGRDEQRAPDSNICISVTIQNQTRVRMKFLLLMTDTITSKKYWLSSWMALHMYPQWKPLHTLCSWSGYWPIWRPWIIVVLLTKYRDFGCAVAESR